MIRLILIILFLIIFFIISIPLWLIEWIIGKFNPAAKNISSLRIVQGAFRIILFLSGVRTEVSGLENIPKDEPVLFVGNHRGFYDVIISYSRMPGVTGFVAKKEIEKVPGLRIWMRMLHCLFIDRANIKEGLKTILKGIDMVKNEHISVAIFPEGTRSQGEEMLPFKEGSFKIAEKSGCKIVPFMQRNTENILETHFPRIKSAKTVLKFGEPIDVASLTKEEKKFLGSYVQNIIQDMYDNAYSDKMKK